MEPKDQLRYASTGWLYPKTNYKLLNTACFKYAFKKTHPTFMPSITSTYVTHLKPPGFGDPVLCLCDHLPSESRLVQQHF